MTQFKACIGGDSSIALKKAILIYSTSHEGGPAYATTHEVDTTPDGRATIMAGVPISTEALGKVVDSLLHASKLNNFLPPEVLSIGFDNVMWWCKPSKRNVFFKCSDERIGTRSAVLPHPGLVFVAQDKSLTVYAVEGEERPTPDTRLCHAPYLNVWVGGKICTGTVILPNRPVTDLLHDWENAFFNSYFTHTNTRAETTITYEGGLYQLWADLLDGKHEQFPKVLLPMGATLGEALKNIGR